MNDQIVIRDLQETDADGVRALDEQILGRDRSASWNEYVERFLRMSRMHTMTIPSWGSQVAEIDGKVAGFILGERQTIGYGMPIGVRIVALAVHPDYRRRGIGRKLVDALKAHCREHGVTQVYSVLQAEDERDARFLAACGFDQAPVRVLACKL
ncbi:MAG: GNAT family N-acetyltransferase [Dehalococcoidia bacterium]